MTYARLRPPLRLDCVRGTAIFCVASVSRAETGQVAAGHMVTLGGRAVDDRIGAHVHVRAAQLDIARFVDSAASMRSTSRMAASNSVSRFAFSAGARAPLCHLLRRRSAFQPPRSVHLDQPGEQRLDVWDLGPEQTAEPGVPSAATNADSRDRPKLVCRPLDPRGLPGVSQVVGLPCSASSSICLRAMPLATADGRSAARTAEELGEQCLEIAAHSLDGLRNWLSFGFSLSAGTFISTISAPALIDEYRLMTNVKLTQRGKACRTARPSSRCAFRAAAARRSARECNSCAWGSSAETIWEPYAVAAKGSVRTR